ncbi:hypothetical protein [Anaerotignum sp.]|uniref:hypothetical protein n=1 Tax=Anaerotignum sp. TaxID=2039241 RepID=UPI0027147071|nr:hypothetical protein [Anaerotignum sp.]
MSVAFIIEELLILLITLYYLAKNYPELIPWVIGMVVAMKVLGFGVNKLVQKTTGEDAKSIDKTSKNKD